ncbi:MAG: cytochrome d ubiquinol oxidase subunit II [Candidatus Midichloriaceae bacterium]|jgi:cytochrome d ubiquinol oxidase subunit II
MLNFSNFIDLPLVWLLILIISISFYVILDGFDLGVGILLPFAPSETCKDIMVNSISPFWDGNETWLVLSGGVLLIAFPLAFSIVIPALYLPIILMLISLLFRGISFEFRGKASPKTKKYWNFSFHFGSLIAAFFQGIILGTVIQGFEVENKTFVGDGFGWLSAFSIVTGIALVFGYALLGATWLILKTENKTQEWAKKSALYVMIYVPILMGIISLWVPFIDKDIYDIWFKLPNILYLLPVPILVIITTYYLFRSIISGKELAPFLLTVLLFCFGFLGFGISIWPFAVPRQITVWEAAAAPESLSLVLVGVVFILPVILTYTSYVYYVFRGKSKVEETY